MIPPVKKVIRASAGTGKTYRLSLEYIGLLLQYQKHGLHFSEILVITFTKKATAEIRTRIFDQMHEILQGQETGQELCRNIESFFHIKINSRDLKVLNDIYIDMLTNKHLVNISTIDSFTNSVFKTIIAPYLGITDYTVQPAISDIVKDELYISILQDEVRLSTLRSFFERSEFKTIHDYEHFIESILRQRWLFQLVKASHVERPFVTWTARANEFLQEFRKHFRSFVRQFQNYVMTQHDTKTAKEVLNSDYYNLVQEFVSAPHLENIATAFDKIIEDSEHLKKHYSLLLDDKKNIWNGSRLLRKKTEASLKEQLYESLYAARLLLADYIFATLCLTEEKDLFQIIDYVLAKYDELKFRDKVFTHDDISYYTFKYLYDPALSLINGDYVSNSFYELLSTYTRFVLIDEFQDTSIIQYKIVLPIIREVISGAGIKEYGGAIIVGDEKQSIYGWRGGERDLLLNMPAVMQETDELTLDISYRSDENIVSFVNAVFRDNALQEHLREQGVEWPVAPLQAAKTNAAGYVEFFLRNIAHSRNSTNNISTNKEAIREFLQSTLNSPTFKKQLLSGKTAILARRNVDLDSFAAVLDELDIPYMLESASSILDHRAIKPIYLFLQFFVYGDFYDLLRFLRSDVVLLDASHLKELLLAYRANAAEKWDIRKILQRCLDIPAVRKTLAFWNSLSRENDPFDIVQKIIEEFNIIGYFALESDLKNVHYFLRLVSEFLISNHEYVKSLKGLLDYLYDNKDNEALRQVGLEDSSAVTLMTIHKSKGLEFDTVLLYWDLSAIGGTSFREMSPYVQWDKNYTSVRNYLFTFNYNSIVAQSSHNYFAEELRSREAIEELNTIYVALTRAKANLFLCFVYRKTGGFEKLYTEKTEKSMVLLMTEHIRTVFQNNYELIHFDENRERGHQGQVVTIAGQAEKEENGDLSFLSDYLDTDRSGFGQIDAGQLEREAFVNFKTVFLERNAVEVGNLVHFYLSFIKRGSRQEKDRAHKSATSFYGTLFSPSQIDAILERVDRFIESHPDVFSPAWTHIYTEFTLFDHDGAELRIDRFMVNEMTKTIEIIDYKTGHIFEPEQLETYITTVRSLPQVQQHGYFVNGRFLEIDVE
ncbi:UvrD-helicase domain-containing protein [candidate division KSB1 bacterium]|nr:UvrD-helicase domain-containing protein [candidate division KSB1 bacterium]